MGHGRIRRTLGSGLVLAAAAAGPAWADVTERVSVGPGGVQADDGTSFEPEISANGRYVAFESQAANLVGRDTNGETDVFVHDRRTGGTRRASVGSRGVQANGPSRDPTVSADGRLVAFESEATNLVPRDTNRQSDVFVRDLAAGVTRLVSVGTGGAGATGSSGGPAISADGRVVAFHSTAGNLVPGDTNDHQDVFVSVP